MKKEFLWGGALSNVQAEGGYLEDGNDPLLHLLYKT